MRRAFNDASCVQRIIQCVGALWECDHGTECILDCATQEQPIQSLHDDKY